MIILQKIKKSYGSRAILNGINYNFASKDKFALVGNNGAGKTTLLSIICSFDCDYDGEVIKTKSLKLGYLPQEPNPNPQDTILKEAISGATDLIDITKKRDQALLDITNNCDQEAFDKYEYLEKCFLNAGGYRVQEDAKNMLIGLGFAKEQFDLAVSTLSGGWKMRLEFAKMLINNPNFLILDEPTNHLDLPSIEWFENYLQNFDGTILFVSHDRDLLNRLSTKVLHLLGGKLKAYTGNFDKFLQSFEEQQLQSEQFAKNLKKQSDHMAKFINRFRSKASKAKQVQSRLKSFAKLKMLEESVEVDQMNDTMYLNINNQNPSGKTAFMVKDLFVGYEQGRALIKKLSFNIMRGSKIAILGANGLGKSTLLKTLIGIIPPLAGEIEKGYKVQYGYFAQEYLDTLQENKSVIENIHHIANNVTDHQIRSMLGSLGITGDEVLKKVKILSGGEKSRVALAALLIKAPNTLLLDEPTNHLDLSACENLALALGNFEGTVIFVSHNRDFIKNVATHKIYLQKGKNAYLEEISNV